MHQIIKYRKFAKFTVFAKKLLNTVLQFENEIFVETFNIIKLKNTQKLSKLTNINEYTKICKYQYN